MPTPAWTEREDRTLATLYPSHGASACRERLGRSMQAIYTRAFQLGLTTDRRGPNGSGPADTAPADDMTVRVLAR